MKDLYVVKFDILIKKGIHKDGYVEMEIEKDDFRSTWNAAFAENEQDAIYKATIERGWKNVRITQVRKYQEVERKDFAKAGEQK